MPRSSRPAADPGTAPEAAAEAAQAAGERGELPGPEGVPALTAWEVGGPAGRLVGLAAGQGGLPVLFVHGLGGRAEHWVAQLVALAGRGRVAALSWRGHAGSATDPEGRYAPPEVALDVLAAAEALGFERFVLVGHSLGAMVAAALAAQHPTRVAGLLLADANGDQTYLPPADVEGFLAAIHDDPSELAWHFQQVAAGGDLVQQAVVLGDLATVPGEVLLACLEAAAHHSSVADLDRYPGPVLAVVSHLNSLPISLHRLRPDIPTELLRGTGHWLMMDDAEGFNRALRRFVAAVEAELTNQPTAGS